MPDGLDKLSGAVRLKTLPQCLPSSPDPDHLPSTSRSRSGISWPLCYNSTPLHPSGLAGVANSDFLLTKMAATTEAPTANVTVADFGSKTPKEVTGIDISRVLAEWLVKSLGEIDEKIKKGELEEGAAHEPYCLDFPAGLPNERRKSLHHHSHALKLESSSSGQGDMRILRLTLSDRSKLSPHILEMVSADALETAINHRELKRHSKVPHGMSLILDYLYLGSGKDAQDKESLQAAGVTTVLNVTAEWRTSHHEDFTHHRISLNDNIKQSLEKAMDDACEIIHKMKSTDPQAKILVHCVMGRSRSAAIVMAYLVRYENMTLKDAFELTHKARPIVRPNSRFLSDLIAWELKHRGTTTQEVGAWIEVVGVHGSQLARAKLPPKLELTPDESRRVADEAVASFVSEELYLKTVESHCGGKYQTDLVPKFMKGLQEAISADAELMAKLDTTGVPLHDACKAAQKPALAWYLPKAPKVERPQKKKAQATNGEASSSSAPAEEAPKSE